MKLTFAGSILCSFFLLQTAALNAQTFPADPQAGQQTTPPPATPPPTPQTAPGTPPTPKPQVQMPPPTPPPVKSTAEDDTGGDAISVEPFYWLTQTSPTLRPGNGNTTTDAYPKLRFPGASKYADGIIFTVPTTRQTNLEFTYFTVKAQGNNIMPLTENFFGNDFTAGDVVATNWLERSMKLSWNFLTWPYPSNGSKFRVKTLWEVQWVQLNSSFDAPEDINAVTTTGSKQVIAPTFGIGIEYHPVKHVRLEAKTSAWGIPHYTDLVDLEASAVLRFGRFEGFVGERYYHFKTSPQDDWYFTETNDGPYFGLRFLITK